MHIPINSHFKTSKFKFRCDDKICLHSGLDFIHKLHIFSFDLTRDEINYESSMVINLRSKFIIGISQMVEILWRACTVWRSLNKAKPSVRLTRWERTIRAKKWLPWKWVLRALKGGSIFGSRSANPDQFSTGFWMLGMLLIVKITSPIIRDHKILSGALLSQLSRLINDYVLKESNRVK